MKKIIVIGGGPGGYVAAIKAAQLGAKVYLIEKDKVGGTCLNYGCIPTKSLVQSASLLNKMKRSQEFGIELKDVSFSLSKIMERKDRVVSTLRKGIEALIKKNKIELILGEAKVKDENSVDVICDDNIKTIQGDYLIIATGSAPKKIRGMEFDGQSILSSTHVLSLRDIPDSVVIVGGGVIGCEFAYVLNSFGCKVTIIEAMSRLLPIPAIDTDISISLHREMKKKKINFLLDTFVTDIKKSQNGELEISYRKKDKNSQEIIKCNKVLISIGREPTYTHVSGLDLTNDHWIKVDDNLKTNIDNIYAIGDCLGPSRPMLAHVASYEADIAVSNIFGANKKVDYNVVPSVVYIEPEIASVGLGEEEAKKRGLEVDISKILLRAIGRAHTNGEISGEAKIVFEKQTKKIVGMHMIGEHASELIATACVLIKQGATLKDLKNTIFAHPTLSEIYHELALKSLGFPLHG